MLDVATLPGWDAMDGAVSRAFGEAWQRSKRSLLLLVPSVVARLENNILIDPEHAEFPRITFGLHQPVWWDLRLFKMGTLALIADRTAGT